ncbi:MAG: hypothetical protein HOV80_16595 [Polyangiaceae bacterium]|nr:hypothetical protein [Polyangiaceae bacterium]
MRFVSGSSGTECDTDEDCWEGLACVEGYCEHVAVCGDGHLDEGEACDDGGEVAGDGCNTDCTVESDATCAALPELAIGATSDNVESPGATAVFTASCLSEPAPSVRTDSRLPRPERSTSPSAKQTAMASTSCRDASPTQRSSTAATSSERRLQRSHQASR